MIPVSVGESLTEYIRIWGRQNKNLSGGVKNFDKFLKWERGELQVNITELHNHYYNKYVFMDSDKFYTLFAEKLKEPVGRFLCEADFTGIELRISFMYVGVFRSRTIKVEPTLVYPEMKIRR